MLEPQPGHAPHPAENTPDLDHDLGYTLQEMVLHSPDVGEFLANFARLAAAEFSTAENSVMCGVTVIRRKLGVVVAGSDDRARDLDNLQNTFGDGPCLTALRHRTIMHVPDTAVESRWPDFMEAVSSRGIGSILAVALDLADEAEAVMNFYSVNNHGFSGANIVLAETFAEHAGSSLRLALQIAQLRHTRDDLTAAMQSRTTIDMAVGVIMAQNRCGRDAAFRLLTQASNHRNIKLRDVAADIIASVSGEKEIPTYFDE